MPKIIRVRLTTEQRAELNQLAHARSVSPRVRDRLEMIRLSDMGHTVPEIAQALNAHQQTVRKYLKLFVAESFDFERLADAPRCGRPPLLTGEHMYELEQLLDQSAASGRTWSMRQLAKWLQEEHKVSISSAHLSERLKWRKFRWKRTVRSLRHKQKDPKLQAEKQEALESLNL